MSTAALRRPVDASAAGIMVLLCFLWGFTYIFSKLAAPDISLVMQGGLRSVFAVVLLWVWARMRGIALFERDGTLGAGLVAGVLFAGEFLFIFAGLAHTGASRMVVFVYLAPCLTALGLHWLVPSERLDRAQWLGIWLAFAGVALAFLDGFASDRASLLGDAFGVIAALLWGATTVVIRTTRLSSASATKTLFYQLTVSAATLPFISMLLGEPGVMAWSAVAVASLFYQSAIVSFASYLTWFWLLRRYLASQLGVF
ncbi:MAG: DMT family transporter, partial [Burkholderiales bacterium]|nr:DMT family transporter [Burkholderiales bacterium]